MRNSPLSLIFEPSVSATSGHIVPGGSSWRVYLPGAAFSLLLVVIAARLVYVQTCLTDRYLAALQATTTELEILPARDGRILASGTVLAADIEQYSVQVHYRWLQAEPNSLWLRQEMRKRLSRKERSDVVLADRTMQEIASAQQRLHHDLADVVGIPLQELRERMMSIETSVQRIADSVNRRYANRLAHAATSQTSAASQVPAGQSPFFRWCLQLGTTLRETLTTPPRRSAEQIMIVREEESWHTVVDSVPLSVAAQIGEHPERFPGTRVILSTQRTYPLSSLAAHVVGAQTRLSETELQQRNVDASFDGTLQPSPAVISRRGRFGVELSYSSELQGTPGVQEIVRNRRHQIVATRVLQQPRSGRDVGLTLDPDLQHHCEQLLAEALTDQPRRHLTEPDVPEANIESGTPAAETAAPRTVPVGGSIVVMDVHSGELLAVVSAPTFDLNLFAGGSSTDWNVVNADRRRPFVSRFSSMALPPGSTFKPLTAVAMLQTETFSARQTFICQGFLHRPEEHRCLIFRQFGQGHGRLSLTAAMGQSCNVYFFSAAERMGIYPLADWAERFGLGAPTGVDLPFEKSGQLPVSAAASAGQEQARRFQREATGFAIGQSRLTVTPLQMVRMMAALANGGWLVTPHVISDAGFARRAEDAEHRPQQFQRIRINELTPETLTAVQRSLTAVCQEPYGTGYKTVRLPHVQIAGKTGTAETSPGKPDHAWFAGYVPADEPQYAFVVVLEHGGSGSHAAGPIAREVVSHLFPPPASTAPN